MYENARAAVTPDLCSRAPVVSRDHVQCRPAVWPPSPVLIQTRTRFIGLRGALLLCMSTHPGEGHPACLLCGHAALRLWSAVSQQNRTCFCPFTFPSELCPQLALLPTALVLLFLGTCVQTQRTQAEAAPERACASALACAEPQHPHCSLGPLGCPCKTQPLSLRLQSSCGSPALRPPPSTCGTFSPHRGGVVTLGLCDGPVGGGLDSSREVGGPLTLSRLSSAGVLTSSGPWSPCSRLHVCAWVT